MWEKRYVRPDGTPGIYGVVDKADYGIAIPTDGRLFYLIYLYRYSVDSMSWEFPQGHCEKGESLLASMKREMTEETGLRGKTFTRLGHLWLACGHHTQGYAVYLAEGCKKMGKFDITEVDQVRGFTLRQIQSMIRQGKIKDSQTVAAIQLYLLRTKRK